MPDSIIGQTLLNQFRIDAFIASGGMGAVYRVWDLKRTVPLAMKVLHTELADDPSVFKRFKREANALKKLTHPNIVPFYGLYQTLDITFLIEYYIDGPSLKEILRLRKGKSISIDEALIYLKALCAALGYAHANGVVHCDVKPGNVMVDRNGKIYLTDFGIARHAESTTTTLGVAGTPAYMAPEQILGKSVTPATDVYSLGVIFFEMLTGRRPFLGNEQSTEKFGTTANERIRYGHLHLSPPDPCSINASLPPSVASILLKALSKNSEDRYSSVSQFLDAVYLATGVLSQKVANQVALEAVNPPRQKYQNGSMLVSPQLAAGGEHTARAWLLGLGGIVFIIIILIVVTVTSTKFSDPNNKDMVIVPPSQIPSPTKTHYPTEAPLPTYTHLPTYTPYPTSQPPPTRPPASSTPKKPPTQPPSPQEIAIVLQSNVFCRRGPGTEYPDITGFFEAQRFSIIGQDRDGWWLVKINIPAVTRRKACWIFGDGHRFEGNYTSVPYMDDFEVGPDYSPP